MSIRFVVRAATALAFIPAAAFAQAVPEEDSIVVTASRTEQRMRDAIPHTTVITSREIRASGAVDLPGLLRREAGFEFSQTGGIGATSSIFLRGAATNQVLVLLDGVRVTSLTTGATQLDQLMLDQIDRVEVVRGNVSSLYGSGAMGGVIQVFTREGRGAPKANLDVGLGGDGTNRLRGGFSGEYGDTRFSINMSHFETDGFSALKTSVVPGANPDRDGYRNRSLSASLTHRFAVGHETGLRLLSSNGRTEFDNAFAAASTDRHRGTTSVGSSLLYLNNQLTTRWLSKLSRSEGRDRFDNYTNDRLTSSTRTRNSQVSWQNDVLLAPEHTVTLGLESLKQTVSSTTAYVRSARDVDALLLGYVGRIGRHAVQLNLRNEDYSDFGSSRTHFAGYGFDLMQQWRITASSSKAFRAPTFNELFFPGFGNVNLRPERSRSSEIGVQYADGPHLARAVAFRSRIVDLINPSPVVNVNEATIDGVEFSYRGTIWESDVRASLTFQDPVQHNSGAADLQLVRRSKAFGSLSVGKSFGPWRLSGEFFGSAHRFDNHITAFPARRVQLARYDAVNFVAEHRFSDQTSILTRLDNAFNKKYELAHGFNTQGRRLSASLRHQF